MQCSQGSASAYCGWNRRFQIYSKFFNHWIKILLVDNRYSIQQNFIDRFPELRPIFALIKRLFKIALSMPVHHPLLHFLPRSSSPTPRLAGSPLHRPFKQVEKIIFLAESWSMNIVLVQTLQLLLSTGNISNTLNVLSSCRLQFPWKCPGIFTVWKISRLQRVCDFH